MERKAHWEQVYATKAAETVSWYQPVPARSLELLERAGVPQDGRIIDIGGGDSRLVDELLARGPAEVTVLDLSGGALRRAQARLDADAARVHWLEADVTEVPIPEAEYDAWHDRAVFHFLVNAGDRARYVAAAAQAVKPGGVAIIGTFAEDGPERCSGLEVARYDATGLAAEFGDAFTLEHSLRDEHTTPSGAVQRFTFVVLRRTERAREVGKL